MSRRKKDPLRELIEAERQELTRISRSQADTAARVARAIMLLAVARGSDYQDAARAAGRRSGDAVSHLVSRFNAEGLDALTPRHGGGRPRVYDTEATGRVIREAGREPTPAADGTATWSLSRLRGALRAAPDGLPRIGTTTIWRRLREAGSSYQRNRTWCPTGTVQRVRKAGPVLVTDPDAAPKNS